MKGDSSARVSLEVEYRHSDDNPATAEIETAAGPEGVPLEKCAWSCDFSQRNGVGPTGCDGSQQQVEDGLDDSWRG